MRKSGILLAWVLALGFVACDSEEPGGSSGDDDDDDSVGSVGGTLGGGAVLAARDAGDLTDGEAALALYRIFFGLLDDVDPALLTDPGDTEAVHNFMGGLALDDFLAEELEALTALDARVFGQSRESYPEGDYSWCRYDLVDQGNVEIYVPSVTPQAEVACLDGNVTPNAAAVADRAVAAAQAANPMFRTALGQSGGPRDLYIFEETPADWGGTYGISEFHTAEYCRVYLTATPLVVDAHVSMEDEVLGTVIHELFHCAQRQEGMNMGNWWLREGTAVWAEDHVGDAHFENVDTEHRYTERFFTSGDFLSRSYDAVNPIIQLSERRGLPLGFDLVAASDPLDALTGHPEFETHWHEISLSTWNEPPVPVWDNDGRALASGFTSTTELLEDTTYPWESNVLGPLGYYREAFEFEEDIDVVTFVIQELPTPDAKLSLIEDSATLVDLTLGVEHVVCVNSVGQCHDTEPLDGDKVVLVATNVSSTSEINTKVDLEMYAPQLHGSWSTLSVVFSGDGQNVQSGSVVTFDEEADPDEFTENLSGAIVYPWLANCSVSGSAAGTVSSEYIDTGEETAFGTTTLTPTSGGPTYSCEDGAVSGAAPGLWATTQGPWGPGIFDLVGDSLTVTSQAVGGVYWTVELQRI
jgi:hypothetical protein